MTRDFASKSNKNRSAQNKKSQKKKQSKTKASNNNRRPQTAEKKNGVPAWAWLLLGLGLGIASVLIGLFFMPSENGLTEDELNFENQEVFVEAPQETANAIVTETVVQQSTTVTTATNSATVSKEASGPEFAFFTLLPEQEVMVQSINRPKKTNKPPARQHRPSVNGKFILQVGSFQQEKDAQRHQQKLRKRGLPSNIQQGIVKETVWYRVFVGPYSTSEQIEYAENKLADLGISPLLIKRN